MNEKMKWRVGREIEIAEEGEKLVVGKSTKWEKIGRIVILE